MRPFRLRQDMRGRSQSGSAAIEFAFVAPVFFLIMAGIIEGGIMMFGKAALINATQDAARKIRTGQVQNGAMNQASFKTEVCNGISVLLNCSNLTVDVQAYPTGFTSGGLSSPTDSNGDLKSGQNNYSTGAPCDVVVVRTFYKYTILTPIVQPLLAGKSGNNFNYLTAAAAFRNEPYTSAVSGC
jgi:Flp pilus assembly protein TadG